MDESKRRTTSREDYELYKSLGVCVQCRQRKAAPGRVRCEECLALNAEKNYKRYHEKTDEERKAIHEKEKAARDKRRAEGKCIWCNKPIDPHSKCYCLECSIKNRRRQEERKDGIARIERPSYGLCYRCGRPIKSGTLCEKCKQTSRNNLPTKMNADLYKHNKEENNLIFRNSR